MGPRVAGLAPLCQRGLRLGRRKVNQPEMSGSFVGVVRVTVGSPFLAILGRPKGGAMASQATSAGRMSDHTCGVQMGKP